MFDGIPGKFCVWVSILRTNLRVIGLKFHDRDLSAMRDVPGVKTPGYSHDVPPGRGLKHLIETRLVFPIIRAPVRTKTLAFLLVSLLGSVFRAADDYEAGPDSKPQEGVPQGDVSSYRLGPRCFQSAPRLWVRGKSPVSGTAPGGPRYQKSAPPA